MTVGVLIPVPRPFVLTAAANTLVGAELHVYENLTTTPVTLYSDRACTTPAANPIVSSAGFFPRRYMASAQLLTLTLKNTAGGTIHSDDYVAGSAESGNEVYDIALTTAGGTTAYTLTSGLSLGAYASGLAFLIKMNATNTGASTLNVDGLGAKNITKNGTSPTVAGDLCAGVIYRVAYDGAQFQIVSAPTADTASAMLNGTITASVGSSALTVAIKTAAGADPSAGDPVRFSFRSATASTGDYTELKATAALSLTISNGSTLGTANGVPFRLWLVCFNDAGTLRLGLINCVTGGASPTAVSQLKENLASATAEGGSGGADSADVFYTGSAVSAKPYRIIGYVEWSSGLATAGAWSAGPSVIQLFGPGIAKPGAAIAVKYHTTTSQTDTTSTSYADTASAIAMTPSSAPNLIRVSAGGPLGASNSTSAVHATIARDGTAIGVPATVYSAGGQILSGATLSVLDAPGGTSAYTYRARIKTNNAATTASYPNQSASTGGAWMVAEEIMA